jgi:hypothetical protein
MRIHVAQLGLDWVVKMNPMTALEALPISCTNPLAKARLK